jgi:hypothetical protein
MDSEPALRRIFLDEEIERRPEEIEEGAAVDIDRGGQEIEVGLGQEGVEGGCLRPGLGGGGPRGRASGADGLPLRPSAAAL